MRRNVMLAGIALAVVLPSAALAQETCEERAQNRVAGTAIGAVAGAVLGSAVAGHHDKTTGAVVGGVAGAVIGNQLAKGPQDCQHAYGWYDNAGRWHANDVAPSAASGYYDQRGQWVDGRPADYRPARDDGGYGERRDDDRGGYDRDAYDRGDYDRGDDDRGAYQRDRADRLGYPEFRRMEDRIRDQIRSGVRDDLIERDDARDLMGQLRDIQAQEAREYRVHGWNLPDDDRRRIRAQLVQLDREVDQIRDEP